MAKRPKTRLTFKNPAATLAMVVIVLLAWLLRMCVNSESFWYDELYTFAFHTRRSWSSIILDGPYSPNNHLLFTLFEKGIGWLCGAFTPVPGSPLPVVLTYTDTVPLRFVSMAAGAAFPIVMAWRIRDRWISAGVLGLAVAAHPWLIAASTEARGYMMMLLLVGLATHCLPAFEKKISWPYIATMIAALYTLPIAGQALLAHAVAMAILHRAGLKRWLIAAGLILLAAGILYGPFLSDIGNAIGKPASGLPESHFAAYLATLGQHLADGWAVGAAWKGIVCAAFLLAGLPIAWRSPPLRGLIATFLVATVLAILCAAFIGNMQWPRLAIWAAPLFVIAAWALITLPAEFKAARWIRHSTSALLAVVLLGAMAAADARLADISPQPILEAMVYADRAAGDRQIRIVGAGMAAQESQLYYGQIHSPGAIAYSLDQFKAIERSGGETWAIVYYEKPLEETQPAFAAYLREKYALRQRFPGRVSSVAVYGPPMPEPRK